MAKSKSKYRRQNVRAKARKRSRRRSGSSLWYAVIAVIVVLGVALIATSRGGRGFDRSHRHAALGVNLCGTWQPDAAQTPAGPDGGIIRYGTDVYAGLHTHGDGIIHFEPATAEDAGSSATVGRFFKYHNWRVSPTLIDFNGTAVQKAGQKCPKGTEFEGQTAVVRWALARNEGSKLKERTDDVSKFAPADDDVIGIFFVPKDADLAKMGAPPSLKNLPDAANTEGPMPTAPPSTTTVEPPGTSTTAPQGSTTTAPPGSTTTSRP